MDELEELHSDRANICFYHYGSCGQELKSRKASLIQLPTPLPPPPVICYCPFQGGSFIVIFFVKCSVVFTCKYFFNNYVNYRYFQLSLVTELPPFLERVVNSDRVWHSGLIHKLKAAGVTGNLLQWFTSYLENRKQRVVLSGVKSIWNYIKAGVPQGSILGPLLFLLYINDIVTEIRSNIRLFADDTSLYIIVDNPDAAAEILNTDLNKISKWAKSWLVKFNPNKNESLIISRKINQPDHPPVFMSNQEINEVQFHKHLGIYIASDCSWHKHIEYVKSKAWSRINVMRKFKYTLDRKSLETIYIAFVRPILEYADVVWDNCTQQEKHEIEKIQLEAARIATGTTKLVSVQKLYDEIGWETLDIRRRKHKLVLFYKMYNDIAPSYLSSLVPRPDQNASRYSLRNANNIRTIQSRTNQYYNSFLPAAIRD